MTKYQTIPPFSDLTERKEKENTAAMKRNYLQQPAITATTKTAVMTIKETFLLSIIISYCSTFKKKSSR